MPKVKELPNVADRKCKRRKKLVASTSGFLLHLMCTGTTKFTNKINLDKLELQILGRSNIKHQLSTFQLFSMSNLICISIRNVCYDWQWCLILLFAWERNSWNSMSTLMHLYLILFIWSEPKVWNLILQTLDFFH